jgi:hypothetical protein
MFRCVVGKCWLDVCVCGVYGVYLSVCKCLDVLLVSVG